jgi:hypothetical protein
VEVLPAKSGSALACDYEKANDKHHNKIEFRRTGGLHCRIHIATVRKLVRMEGICGSGKSTIARKLAAKGIGLHIEVDKFAVQQPKDTPYLDCLKREELDAAIERAIRSDKIVILDAVCLGDVAPIERWRRGISIHVRRLSFNNVDPVWHAGFNLEDDPHQTSRTVQSIIIT